MCYEWDNEIIFEKLKEIYFISSEVSISNSILFFQNYFFLFLQNINSQLFFLSHVIFLNSSILRNMPYHLLFLGYFDEWNRSACNYPWENIPVTVLWIFRESNFLKKVDIRTKQLQEGKVTKKISFKIFKTDPN